MSTMCGPSVVPLSGRAAGLAEDVFKNVQMFKGMPAAGVLPAMVDTTIQKVLRRFEPARLPGLSSGLRQASVPLLNASLGGSTCASTDERAVTTRSQNNSNLEQHRFHRRS